jgi:tetratricopeptide (TPR) repeat protein
VPWTELDALEALDRGDTTRARELARGFVSADSARAKAGGIVSATRLVARAEVYTALGDLRRALATYESLEPSRIGDGGFLEPAMALWARSYLARGRIHEQLGERAAAAAAYERFIALWKDADPALQPQLREARTGLARVRDASTPSGEPSSSASAEREAPFHGRR